MADLQSTFAWYEFVTPDVAAAKAFYGTVVGWTTRDVPMPAMSYTVLHAGEAGIGGIRTMPREACDAGMRPHWAGYIHSADVDGDAVKLLGLGGKVQRAPTDIPNVGRFASVSDPQGAQFHLFKPGQAGGPIPSNAAGHIAWHELHTTDWPKAFDFYSAMFGWVKGDSIDLGPMGIYQCFTINGAAMGGMINSPVATTMRFWLYYFNVGDIDAAALRIKAGGGQVLQGPHQVPGGGWMVTAADPQGAWFALLGARP